MSLNRSASVFNFYPEVVSHVQRAVPSVRARAAVRPTPATGSGSAAGLVAPAPETARDSRGVLPAAAGSDMTQLTSVINSMDPRSVNLAP